MPTAKVKSPPVRGYTAGGFLSLCAAYRGEWNAAIVGLGEPWCDPYQDHKALYKHKHTQTLTVLLSGLHGLWGFGHPGLDDE